jgi:hypothetical protein
MILIPKRYSYIEAYLTLRCNLSCKYCVNSYSGITRHRDELSAKQWIDSLNKIKTNGLPITLGGGEPTIHKGFYEIVNGIKSGTIDLLTNGQFDIDEFIESVPVKKFTVRGPEYKAIRMSYHVKSMDAGDLAERAGRLIDVGYNVGIFGINHPENLSANVMMTEICARMGIYFFVRDFLGYYRDRLYGNYKYYSALNGNKKDCLCRTSELLIGPEGNIYRCHRDLYSNEGVIASITNKYLDIDGNFRKCSNYGLCNPCDSKEKISPDLVTSRCAIEVEIDEK